MSILSIKCTIQNNDIIEKAINIGLRTLKDNGEI